MDQCDDIRAQIAEALATMQERGVLTADAIACGEDGVANRRESFDPRATEEAIMSLQEDFAAACDELARC